MWLNSCGRKGVSTAAVMASVPLRHSTRFRSRRLRSSAAASLRRTASDSSAQPSACSVCSSVSRSWRTSAAPSAAMASVSSCARADS